MTQVRIKPVDFDESATEDLVTVAGAYGEASDFFASIARMRQGFIDGYRLAATTVDTSAMRPEERERLRRRAASAGRSSTAFSGSTPRGRPRRASSPSRAE